MRLGVLGGVLALACFVAGFAPTRSEAKAGESVSGSIKVVGSDTMVDLAKLWVQGFKKKYPNVTVELEGKGSGTAPPALKEGSATFGNMSREMTKDESEQFQGKYGYPPTAVPVAWDMLAIYVNKDNPIAKKGLTLQQVDAIFSKNRKAGGDKDIKTWGDLGLEGDWADKPITLYGRNSASGTYLYFKDHVLKKGDFKDTVKEQPGSAAVVQGVAAEKYAIGYSGIGYKTADVAAVPVAAKASGKRIEAAPENKANYPLARLLYIYVNKDPKKGLDPLRAAWLDYVLGTDGQTNVKEEGYLPLEKDELEEATKLVGLGKK